MPIDLLAAGVGIYAVLQALSVLLTGLETAAKQIECRSTFVARDGTAFEEFALPEIDNSQIMLRDFEETRGEALLASSIGLRTNA